MTAKKEPTRDGFKLIFRPWQRLPDGKIIYAKWYGLRAFPMWVPDTDAPSGAK